MLKIGTKVKNIRLVEGDRKHQLRNSTVLVR